MIEMDIQYWPYDYDIGLLIQFVGDTRSRKAQLTVYFKLGTTRLFLGGDHYQAALDGPPRVYAARDKLCTVKV